LWKKESTTNTNRLAFIKACKLISGIQFEGGFAPRQKKDIKGFDEHTVTKWFPQNKYIKKTKQSAVVFNTPAVYNCHGWKLGEFLALGKAIITTPIINVLPENLTHHNNVFVVNDPKELRSAIEYVLSNKEFKNLLEENAYAYYCKHLQPSRVIEKLVLKLMT
jgi:glycosyltransferase involved in cell wall biosynthesis